MPDPFKPVQPGEPVVYSATAWNAMLAAGKAARGGAFDGGVGGPLTTLRSSTLVKVRNDSGDDLGRANVLGLDDPVFVPDDTAADAAAREDAFLREVTFAGLTPDATHRGKFCVLLEPVPAGGFARAWVAGACHVLVDVTSVNHRFADIAAGETGKLVSGRGGGAEILWREGGTGLQWAVVRLGPTSSNIAVASGSITARVGATYGTGSATFQNDTGTVLVNVGSAIPVKNMTDKVIASGAYLFLQQALGSWWVVAVGSCANLT